MVSDLPRDLSEEVLSRIPLTSLRKVRSTCKKWNTLSKTRFLAKKHLRREAEKAKEEFMAVVMMDYSVYLLGVNLSDKAVQSCSVKLQGKLTFPTDSDSDQIDICNVFHCDGLLLCVSKDQTRLVRFPRDLEIAPIDWKVDYIHSGVTVNGNAYWLATEDESELDEEEYGRTFLVGFDFTRETFGPRLPLPFQHYPKDAVSLSPVRGGKLAALFQPWDSLGVKIWVTSKIEPEAVTWESEVFLSVSLKQSIHPMFQFTDTGASFFIDEEKKVAVVFDEAFPPRPDKNSIGNQAYIIGVDGSLKIVDLGVSDHRGFPPLACSYLPSLIQPN
ncbi:unnamed protein product [Microthlaspi erraticum]|uniref:F-box domain-containing protein n=1 Tax=Microthlaspi erraticum TaxID=1685480 RepID=A0A6D2HAV9_9BRAS|nr:unnamed protein product [Microthlaspi erraticum]